MFCAACLTLVEEVIHLGARDQSEAEGIPLSKSAMVFPKKEALMGE